jgi:hypothetical protein
MRTPLLLPPASPKLSTGARVALQLSGSIQGTVIDGAGVAVSKAVVYAFPEQVTSRQIQTTADQQGRFAFKGLPTGRVYLGAFRKSDAFPSNFFAFFNQTLQNFSTIEVKTGNAPPDIVINLGHNLPRLTLDPVDENGTPLRKPMRIIFTRDDMPGEYRQAATAPYSILVPCVPFLFSVEVEGYQLWGSERIRLQPGETLEMPVKLQLK